ncbi:MAG: UPF0175 family protein [Caldilineaceae bacterium]|nr:UPF0175 family protein [Caldilineaceae bacterium]MCB0139212.1 UPF0175 family protein [Caldilineaceae bacterium]
MTFKQLTIEVPDKILLAEKKDEAAFAKEMRMLAAIKLFELGRLSSGRAADLAGVSRVEFLLSLEKYQVFPFAAELDDLEAEYA